MGNAAMSKCLLGIENDALDLRNAGRDLASIVGEEILLAIWSAVRCREDHVKNRG